MELRCHNIVVTGGAGGIGLAIAKRLLAGGGKVVIAGRTPEKLERAADECNNPGLATLVWDVSDFAAAKEMLCRAEDMMGGLDGLVNNAAIGASAALGRGYEPWDITPEEWSMLDDVNLKGAFFVMRDMIDLLLERKRPGNILNISSNAACMDIVGEYGVAKLGLMRLTRALGKRYGDRGIIINGIAPGATFTPIIAHYAHSVDQPYPRHALGRFIRPEEIAELAAYLMSPWGEIICGHTVVADAGDRSAFG